jgi:hypothetical protein
VIRRLDCEQNPGHGLAMSLPPESSSGAGTALGQTGPGSFENATPTPGELHIKGRRTWATWQLVVAVGVAILIGFALNGTTGGSATASSGAPAYKVPASAGSVSTTTAPGGSTTTTAAGGSTTTTAAGGSTTTVSTAAPGPARVLLGPSQMSGNWTSPAFTTTAAGWNIGWAFNCSPAPASGPSFQVSVAPAGSSAAGAPVVSGTGASGQSVTSQSSLGSQTLAVQAATGCTWVVKVTGS